MSVYGRRQNPGENTGVSNALNRSHIHNRTIRAQVENIDSKSGIATFVYDGLPGSRHATIPPLWMSFPESGGPAWGRYMPQVSDLVKLSFDHADKAHVVGYDIEAGKDGVGDGRAGWPQLHDQYVASQSSSDASRVKFKQFAPLNPGEYDFMSSGGSYIYGNNAGKLFMAGGASTFTLNKNDSSITGSAQYFSHVADDCVFRFGQVRRQTTSGTVGPIPAVGESLKEFNVVAKSSSATKLAEFSLGNVYVDLTPIMVGDIQDSARVCTTTFNDGGVESFRFAVGANGNIDMNSKFATQIAYDFQSATWISTVSESELIALTKATINSPVIHLGKNATDSLVMGTTYMPKHMSYVTSMNTAITTATGTITTANTAIVALLATATAAIIPLAAIPIGGAMAVSALLATLFPLISIQLVLIATANTTLNASVTAATTTLTATQATYLSNVSKTL